MSLPAPAFTPIPACIAAFRAGAFLIVLDSPARENEGDLIIAAAALSPARAAFMVRHTSGYLCAPLAPARAAALALPPMVAPARNADPNGTAYTVTVDAVPGALAGREHEADFAFDGETPRWGAGAPRAPVPTTTGISAADRSRTCNVLAHPGAVAADVRRPGHVVPLIARAGGVRERRGHTEAGWELCRLAGLEPAVAVIGELVEAEGEAGAGPESGATGMMRAEACVEFGRRWGIACCTIEDLVAYLEETEGTAGGDV